MNHRMWIRMSGGVGQLYNFVAGRGRWLIKLLK